MSTAPLLSIGMIFKNEERCLERCLKSLAPLREAIPCELIMADTGAEDGSREIAEQYADEVFDFEWINDFAAARNAVMDRCHGKWYLTVDSDEWLDADISELVAFLTELQRCKFAFVLQRNYFSLELEQSEAYSDFRALRLARLTADMRYHGTIHESWTYQEPAPRLTHTILHHDGYCLEDPKDWKAKAQRNMKLLLERLEQIPGDPRTLLQCIESGGGDADFIWYLRQGIESVRKKAPQWNAYGAPILNHAIEAARVREMPEFEEWVQLAKDTFPNSIYIRVDVNYTVFLSAYNDKEWGRAAQAAEDYLTGLRDYRAASPDSPIEKELVAGSLRNCTTATERTVRTGLANAYLQNGQSEKALEVLTGLDGQTLDPAQVRNAAVALSQIHAESDLDVASALTAFYEQIGEKGQSEEKQRARLAAFDAIAAAAFSRSYRKEEQTHNGYHRPAYTAFAALGDRCEAGRGARVMLSADPGEMRKILAGVEDWQALPIESLEHALDAGMPFPLPERPLPAEVLDGLAAQMTHGENYARRMVLALPENPQAAHQPEEAARSTSSPAATAPAVTPVNTASSTGPAFDPQKLFWTLSLVLAALRSFDWTLGKSSRPASEFYCPPKEKEEKAEEKPPASTPEVGLALIRRFAQVESALLPRIYAPEMLSEECAALLPPMHRWGLYSTRALAALDSGRPQEYLATLRRGLKACPGQKDIVQFLLDRFMEDARPKTSPELLALAEKVRTILAAYSPDDPAVAAIRENPAYKQVAWIIEETPGLPVQ